jgi:hypothetical protein
MTKHYELPEDISAAYWSTKKALACTNTLLTVVRDSSKKLRYRDALPEWGYNWLDASLSWLHIAGTHVYPLRLHFTAAVDQPAILGKNVYPCHFLAALAVVEDITGAVWLNTDPDGVENNELTKSKVIANWFEALPDINDAFASIEKPNQMLFAMLYKEAARAAANRGGFIEVSMPPPTAEGTRCSGRNQLWAEWYMDPASGCLRSPAKIRDRWNKMSESDRKAASPRCYGKVQGEGLQQAANTVLQAIKAHMGIESWSASQKSSENH